MAWSKSTRIIIMIAIDVAFFFLELGVGVAVGSLALLADAFHMLNDVISLIVGLWAVNAAQKATTDKYSFGWKRAEILGAFFNAVFLIALCLSIMLEAIGRLIDPPKISNPKLILIVGCLGLASNIAGIFVLGGHGHSHGPGDSHSHGDEVRSAEEGHSHSHDGHAHSHGHAHGDEVAHAPYHDDPAEEEAGGSTSLDGHGKAKPITFGSNDEEATTVRDSGSDTPISRSTSGAQKRHERQSPSASRLNYSIHPSSFRQEIIDASKRQLDGIESGDSSDPEEANRISVDSNSPLLNKTSPPHHHDHDHDHTHERGFSHSHSDRPQIDSHAGHNHTKPRKAAAGGGGHNHADMGMNGMVLHVIGDALGNIGVIVAALIIWLTEWSGKYYSDPAVSLFITLIILKTCIPLTKASAKILLQATPDHIDVSGLKEDIQDISGIISCHHVHIWQLTESQYVASMHIQVIFPISEAGGAKYMELSKTVRKCLHAHGIHSVTIQPEFCLDKDHDHINAASAGFDGTAASGAADDDSCLLECIDDCDAKGCCPPTKNSRQGSQAGDSGHDHDHDHGDHSH